MKDLGIACALMGILLVSVALAQNAKLSAPSGYLPEVVTIKASMLDTARICVEPPAGGLVACRTIGELRKWARERPGR